MVTVSKLTISKERQSLHGFGVVQGRKESGGDDNRHRFFATKHFVLRVAFKLALLICFLQPAVMLKKLRSE